MELKVLPFDTLDGLVPGAGTTLTLNEWPEYAAGYLTAAVMLHSPDDGPGGLWADLDADVSGAEWLTLTLASLRRPSGPLRRESDARVRVVLLLDGAEAEYAVPTYMHATRVRLPLNGASRLEGLGVESAPGDRLTLSNALAVRAEMPLDLMNAVKAGLERQRALLVGDGIPLGTMTCRAGDRRVTVDTDWSWLERYAVFSVGDGADREVHQADNATGASFTLGLPYGGPAMLRDHDAAPVRLTFPVEVGRFDVEARLPGLCVWYTSPGPAPLTARLDHRTECFLDGEAVRVRDGARVAWRVMIDHEARSPELVAVMTQACRNLLAEGVLWVHGAKVWFEWSEPAVDAEPDLAYDILPRTAYALTVEVREDSWPQTRTATSGPASLQVSPSPSP